MVHAKPALPAGHGEILTLPTFDSWADLARSNHLAAKSWTFEVAGRPAAGVRALARREALAMAEAFSDKLGVAVDGAGSPDDLIVAAGHQPELYHPGVWIKDFLLQRLAEESGATAFDLVVDSDGFDALTVSAPCMTVGVQRCRQYLAVGGVDAFYAGVAVPDAASLDDFCAAADSMLSSLSAPAIRHHFSTFCEQLREAATVADNLAELVTIARRRYEASAGTTYLELPMTHLATSEAFALFAADIALNAERFGAAYNAELAEYREVNKTRSAAQPFPDLALLGARRELPFWVFLEGRRTTAWVEPATDGVRVVTADGDLLAELLGGGEEAVAALRASDVALAPKALALTLFARLFTCDLFIHGVGGGRYDRVTDGVCRRYYGVDAPAFVVASITMYLPLGAHVVTDEEVAAAKGRLNRLEHNPDALLGEVEFDTAKEQTEAAALASEKSSLVEAIARPDADKKSIGRRIREVNAALADLLGPMRVGMETELASLESQRDATEILTDRTYPFCFWSPQEVADKAR